MTEPTSDVLRAAALARLAAIVESSDDAIVSKTLDGVIRSWNKGAERIFGYTAEEAIGRSITILIPPDRQNEEPQILARIQAGERVDHFETVRVTKSGKLLDISVTISPLRDESGRIVGASKIARDITEQKRAQRELAAAQERERQARLEAERASSMKDEFLATLSHELRTPLNAIVGYANLMRTGTMSHDEIAEAMDVIDRNARTQAQIIEDLLDMSRIISGKIRLDVQRVDLASVVTAALDTLRPSAELKGVHLTAVLDPLVGPVTGDPNRLQQVVWNLVTNAIKFTPRTGKVQVALERVNSHVDLVVSDTGEGIDPEFLPHVFERFRQADTSTKRRHGGLGLGLSIVKQLVELHGGTVRAKSPGVGQGATFIVSLPLSVIRDEDGRKRVHPRHPSGEAAATDHVDLSGVRVLAVDDEPDARRLIARILQTRNAEVVTAGSVEEALDVFNDKPPDVLISDLGMPDTDGYELIRKVRLRGAREGGAVPAMALSAFARSEDRRRSLLAGYQTHVAKPVEPAELLVVVANLAGRIGRPKT